LTREGAAVPIAAMDEDRTQPPKQPERSAAEIRRAREAEALRANLRRRKEQQRARETPACGEIPKAGEASTGEPV